MRYIRSAQKRLKDVEQGSGYTEQTGQETRELSRKERRRIHRKNVIAANGEVWFDERMFDKPEKQEFDFWAKPALKSNEECPFSDESVIFQESISKFIEQYMVDQSVYKTKYTKVDLWPNFDIKEFQFNWFMFPVIRNRYNLIAAESKDEARRYITNRLPECDFMEYNRKFDEARYAVCLDALYHYLNGDRG
jgi:hypothetical protein